MSLDSLRRFLDRIPSVTVLTGAGVSTASGIPDYRDDNGKWKAATPVQFAEFAGSEDARRRYWARSYVGWQRFGQAEPNAAHRSLARLEAAGKVDTLITQNVDKLHSRAGSQRVIDLHGDLSRVRCIDCNETTSRADYQERIRAANPGWHARVFEFRPDGDAELADASYAEFPAQHREGHLELHVLRRSHEAGRCHVRRKRPDAARRGGHGRRRSL